MNELLMKSLGLKPKGKSGFKGSEVEQEIVNQEKDVKEKSRMLFALDIKIDRAQGEHERHLMKERQKLKDQVDQAMVELEKGHTSVDRFHQFLDRLDQVDNQRRKKRGLDKA